MLARIENALPGRESFDIEIYGMVGVPEADLAEWRSRRGKRSGQAGSSNGGASGPASKRQKIENVALTPEQLKAQLEAHKALMSGKSLPPGAVAGQFHSPNPAVPPPNMMGYPPGPPPGFGTAPPPMYNRPPPGFGSPPPINAPPPAGPYAGPPPGFYPTGPPPMMTAGAAPARPMPMVIPNISLPATNPHQEAVKSGAKSRMVYNDATMSPEEKLATTSKYLYIDPEEARQGPAPATTLQSPLNALTSSSPGMAPQYYGPPPGFGPPPQGGSVSSPYAGSPHSSYNSSQQQHSTSAPGPPASLNHAVNPSQPHAQAYPAISNAGRGGAEPPSSHPEENTAEALARANQSVGQGVQREMEMGEMERQAKADREMGVDLGPEPVGVTEIQSSGSAAQNGGRPGRARAADLF